MMLCYLWWLCFEKFLVKNAVFGMFLLDFCMVCVAFFDIYEITFDYINRNMVKTANNDTLSLIDHDKHDYDAK